MGGKDCNSALRELEHSHIPNGEAGLKALMPREVARAVEDIAAVEVNITSRYRAAIAALCAAVETWVPRTRGAAEPWKAIHECFTFDYDADYGISLDRLWDKIRDVLDAWPEESPVEFQSWKEAVEEACRQNTVYHETEKDIEWILEHQENQPVKVGSLWEAEMNSQLRILFNFFCGEPNSSFKRLIVQELFREAEESFHF
ncbi:unnamed protein product [Sphagnum tenellum]